MSKSLVRLSGIAYESLVNGPGLRRVFFAQGCKHNCKGCFNPDTHRFDGGELKSVDELIDSVKFNPMIKGVTFSGGDPFEQAKEFAYIAEKIKSLGLNVWCYTGYTFEHILECIDNESNWNKLVNNVDILVDGRFDENKKECKLKFRGSSNQRIIDVKKSISVKKVITLDFVN